MFRYRGLMSKVEQPYAYHQRELVEPDWTRVPGWASVTQADWDSAQWQRAHCVKSIAQLRALIDAQPHNILLYQSFLRNHDGLRRDSLRQERITKSFQIS